MADFAKGMATNSGWALVRCDCRNRIQQDRAMAQRALMDRARTMKVAAAAGDGDDVHTQTSFIESFQYRQATCFISM